MDGPESVNICKEAFNSSAIILGYAELMRQVVSTSTGWLPRRGQKSWISFSFMPWRTFCFPRVPSHTNIYLNLEDENLALSEPTGSGDNAWVKHLLVARHYVFFFNPIPMGTVLRVQTHMFLTPTRKKDPSPSGMERNYFISVKTMLVTLPTDLMLCWRPRKRSHSTSRSLRGLTSTSPSSGPLDTSMASVVPSASK